MAWLCAARYLDWHPLIARVSLVGAGMGQLRRIETRDGKEIVERLVSIDDPRRIYRYTLVAGIPASYYGGTIEVTPKDEGCIAAWQVQFLASNQPDIVVRTMVSTLVRTGLESLKARFGSTYEHKAPAIAPGRFVQDTIHQKESSDSG